MSVVESILQTKIQVLERKTKQNSLIILSNWAIFGKKILNYIRYKEFNN